MKRYEAFMEPRLGSSKSPEKAVVPPFGELDRHIVAGVMGLAQGAAEA
jgi:hypothetical protein